MSADLATDENLSDESTSGLGRTEIIMVIGVLFLMVGVGASCDRKLFMKMFRSRKAISAALVGVACQFGIMPVVSYLLAMAFGITALDSPATALGFVLVGCMPGGSSSNVFTMWGKGILELSVFMTIMSTLTAFLLTPFWLFVFSKALGIDNAFAFIEIATAFAMIVVPISFGALLTYCFPTWQRAMEKGLNVVALAVFFGAIVAVFFEYPGALDGVQFGVYVPAILLFPVAGCVSYIFTTLLRFEPAIKRTIVMEVGLQNLSLGFAIGLLITKTDAQRAEIIPFPLIYSICMYGFAFLLIPLFRYQSKRNIDIGAVDNDLTFMDDKESNVVAGDVKETVTDDIENSGVAIPSQEAKEVVA